MTVNDVFARKIEGQKTCFAVQKSATNCLIPCQCRCGQPSDDESGKESQPAFNIAAFLHMWLRTQAAVPLAVMSRYALGDNGHLLFIVLLKGCADL